jgi:hypothetical protein
VDLEGVGEIFISLADVRELKAKGDQQADLLKHVRSLLGGEADDRGEGEEA